MSYRKPDGAAANPQSATSLKVQAWRQKTKDAGFSRQDVFVSESTKAQLKQIAAEQNMSVVNVASGLLELGLEHYQAIRTAAVATAPLFAESTQRTETLGYVVPPAALLSSLRSSALNTATAGSPEEPLRMSDPVASFFEKRKL